MSPSPRWLVPALILALGSLIGTNTALAKGLVVGGIAPLSLLLWHQAGATVVLLAVLAWRGEAENAFNRVMTRAGGVPGSSAMGADAAKLAELLRTPLDDEAKALV